MDETWGHYAQLGQTATEGQYSHDSLMWGEWWLLGAVVGVQGRMGSRLMDIKL